MTSLGGKGLNWSVTAGGPTASKIQTNTNYIDVALGTTRGCQLQPHTETCLGTHIIKPLQISQLTLIAW